MSEWEADNESVWANFSLNPKYKATNWSRLKTDNGRKIDKNSTWCTQYVIVIIAFPWKEQTHTSSPIYTYATQKRLPKRIIILRAHSANSAHWILYACMPNMNAKHVCTCHLKENPKETRETRTRCWYWMCECNANQYNAQCSIHQLHVQQH